MPRKSKLIQIIRDVGAPEVPKIKLTGILKSPEQDLFSFSFGNDSIFRNILEDIGNLSVNIRFITKSLHKNNVETACICTDSRHQKKVKEIFFKKHIGSGIDALIHQPAVRILSIYPFKGDPKIAKRLFDVLRSQNIEVLAANTAISVISCVILSDKLSLAMEQIESAFSFG